MHARMHVRPGYLAKNGVSADVRGVESRFLQFYAEDEGDFQQNSHISVK
jgi:hypothetical protein